MPVNKSTSFSFKVKQYSNWSNINCANWEANKILSDFGNCLIEEKTRKSFSPVEIPTDKSCIEFSLGLSLGSRISLTVRTQIIL